MSPSIEYTDPKAMSFGRPLNSSRVSSDSRCARSLWRNILFSHPEWRIPSIIEAWLSASEKMTRPGTSCPSVCSVAEFETKPDVKSKAACFPCRSASSRSNRTCKLLVPEMLRVPPKPAPFPAWPGNRLLSLLGCVPVRDNHSNTTRRLRPGLDRDCVRLDAGRRYVPDRRIRDSGLPDERDRMKQRSRSYTSSRRPSVTVSALFEQVSQ